MDYFTTTEFMTTLGLDLREQAAFAIIYSFSQDNEGCWWGSIATLSKWLGNCTTPTTISVLKRLVSKGLVLKREFTENGVKRCQYTTSKKIIEGYLKNLSRGTEISLDNNDTDKSVSKDKIRNNTYTRPFDFYNALLSIGVTEQTAKDWMLVRKQSKAVDTETAFNGIANEIRKAGAPAEACIRLAVERNWRGFRADWYANSKQSNTQQKKRTLDELDPVTYMAVQAGIIPNPLDQPDYDEQY